MSEPNIIRKKCQPDKDPTELIDIKVIPQELFVEGQHSIIKVIRSGDLEGLTVSQIAEMTNIGERAVWKHIYRYAITTVPLGQQSLRSLKDAGILLLHARRAILVPKASVQQLLKLISTRESWAIYYQLWNNSEKLIDVEAKLLDTAGKLKAVLDESAIQKANLRIKDQQIAEFTIKLGQQDQQIAEFTIKLGQQDQQIAELNARLEAADHHIALGGNKKSPKFSIPIYRREPNDIFNNPVYSIEIVKKTRDEMNPDEQHRFQTYHSTRTIVGLSRGLEKTFDKLGVTNDEARSMLTTVKESALALKEHLEPNAQGLFALNRLEPQIYLN
jgi:hypothetical protein